MFADFIVPFWNGMPISPGKSACGKVSRVRHMVPGGSRKSLPKRKVRLADKPEIAEHKPRLQVVILELVPNSEIIDLLS
jgi:hypothetical protein